MKLAVELGLVLGISMAFLANGPAQAVLIIRQAILMSLLPTVQQTQLCERIAGCCRARSNVALDLGQPLVLSAW